jgi:hypothetical protein
VGIGCVALGGGRDHGRHLHRRTPGRGEPVVTAIFSGASTGRAAAGARPSPSRSPVDRSSWTSAAASPGILTREFGPEQGAAARSVAPVAARAQAARSVAAVAARAQAARSTPSASAAAQREFGPG